MARLDCVHCNGCKNFFYVQWSYNKDFHPIYCCYCGMRFTSLVDGSEKSRQLEKEKEDSDD